MTPCLLAIAMSIIGQAEVPAVKAWDISRSLTVNELKRSYHFHLPKGYDPKKATPVVMVLHGAGTNGKIMEYFCGMNAQSDQSGFICVYPNGTGTGEVFLTWNAGFFPGILNTKRANDIEYLRAVLDDLATAANVDPKRTYVCGMSNGGMMSYRAAAEMSDRFAAMASVAGTLVTDGWQPKHPMPVLHFHGTEDGLVPFEGSKKSSPQFLKFPAINEVMKICCKANGCGDDAKISELPTTKDKIRVSQRSFGKGDKGAEVVLYVLQGGGHVWPGRQAPSVLGSSTHNVNANEVIWEFFRKYTRE